ncbi:hypothetical protein FGIG_02584 [Fasciola gigantica]|uniref:Uncharacterized protein n=1 Tax=Fasciola gigantica TaxID=46835 RepID=A0A504YTG2_FASGI|nr:hypothetical protein FGIG_02584 [Fasciola gigantica]
MHSVSGNRFLPATTQPYAAHRSQADMKIFGNQNKIIPGHPTGRLIHSTDQPGMLHGTLGVGVSSRIIATQLLSPVNAPKMSNSCTFHVDVPPVSNGVNGALGTQTSIATTAASLSPYQNASGKCCMM